MHQTIQFEVLGSFTVVIQTHTTNKHTSHKQQVALPKTKDAQRLLAYLLLYPDQTHLRTFLVGLFWPDLPEQQARRRLTRALAQLRGYPAGLDLQIQADVNTIRRVSTADVWVDYQVFSQRLMPHLQHGMHSPSAVEALTEAAQLYRGELLPGFYDEWLLPEQRRAEGLYRMALMRLVEAYRGQGRYQNALEYLLRLNELDPFDEANQRAIMQLYRALDQPQAAIEHYQRFQQYLLDELDAAPEAATQMLYEQLRQVRTEPQSATPHLPAQPQPLSLLLSADRVTLPLIGRETERQQLLLQLNQLFDAELAMGGLILVEGAAGVGKTKLVQTVVHDLAWRGAQVVWHDSLTDGFHGPYTPYIQLLEIGLTELRARQIAAEVEPALLQELAHLLPAIHQWLPEPQLSTHTPQPQQLSPDLGGTEAEQLRFVMAYAQILLEWSQAAPLIVVLDNLDQWSPDCLHVLNLLLPRMMESALIFVGLYQRERARQDEAVLRRIEQLAGAQLFLHMTVPPLSATATTALIRTALATVTPMPHFEQRLYTETAGNPLFLLALLSALYENELLTYGADRQWHTPLAEPTATTIALPLPSTLQTLLEQHLARLAVDERAILEYAVIWGHCFTLTRVLQLTPYPMHKVLAVLAQFEQRGLIIMVTVGYQFRPDLIRQAAYDAMQHEHRQARHHRALQLLRQELLHQADAVPAYELLYHAQGAELWAEAVHYALAAAREAHQVYAMETALAHLAQADDLLRIHMPFDRVEQAAIQAEIRAAEQQWQRPANESKPPEQERIEPAPTGVPATIVPHEGLATVRVRLAKTTAPAFGRALHEDEMQTVAWTLHHPHDGTIQGKKALRQHRLQRLVEEAVVQGAIPTAAELATALQVSEKTIHRDLQQLRRQGTPLPTRGSRS